jgi:hypothetical protein
MYQSEGPLGCEFNDENGFDGQMDFDPIPEEDDVLASGSTMNSQSVRTDFSCFAFASPRFQPADSLVDCPLFEWKPRIQSYHCHATRSKPMRPMSIEKALRLCLYMG